MSSPLKEEGATMPLFSEETVSLTRNSSQSSESSSNGSKKAKKIKKCITNRFHTVDIDEKGHVCSQSCIDKYPIHHACRMGDFQKLKDLLGDPNLKCCPLIPDECLGRTPLHYACSTGN